MRDREVTNIGLADVEHRYGKGSARLAARNPGLPLMPLVPTQAAPGFRGAGPGSSPPLATSLPSSGPGETALSSNYPRRLGSGRALRLRNPRPGPPFPPDYGSRNASRSTHRRRRGDAGAPETHLAPGS